jgi:hypothetical protein
MLVDLLNLSFELQRDYALRERQLAKDWTEKASANTQASLRPANI